MVLAAAAVMSAQCAPLTPGEPIPLTGTQDGFDFIRMDATWNRLLLGHEGNKSFDVFDIATKKLLKVVPTGASQDAAVDVKRGKYYVSGNDPARMVIVDAKTLEITGEVPTPSDTDLIAFNPASGLVYECNDKAGEVWVIDPEAKKIVSTIKFAGKGMEGVEVSPDFKHVYQAVKGNATIAVIDASNNKIETTWSCAPGKSPHGIAILPEYDGLLAACEGKLVLFNLTTGSQLAVATITGRVDEMTYDPGLHMAYCAGRNGKISVVSVKADGLTPLGDVEDEKGTGDITVDPTTHTVWIAYKKGDGAFVQPFTPTK